MPPLIKTKTRSDAIWHINFLSLLGQIRARPSNRVRISKSKINFWKKSLMLSKNWFAHLFQAPFLKVYGKKRCKNQVFDHFQEIMLISK